jgi:prevent-host-death family protein
MDTNNNGDEGGGSISQMVSTRDFRDNLSEVLGRAAYGGERIGITKNGRMIAVVIGVGDLKVLEGWDKGDDFEMLAVE